MRLFRVIQDLLKIPVRRRRRWRCELLELFPNYIFKLVTTYSALTQNRQQGAFCQFVMQRNDSPVFFFLQTHMAAFLADDFKSAFCQIFLLFFATESTEFSEFLIFNPAFLCVLGDLCGYSFIKSLPDMTGSFAITNPNEKQLQKGKLPFHRWSGECLLPRNFLHKVQPLL